MDQVQAWSGIKPDRSTPSGWVQKKIDHLTPLGMTVRRIGAPLTNAKLADLIAELNDGQDIEMVFEGHVVDLVGLRRLSDGNVDFDVFDDNQRDGNVADPMRTARLGVVSGPNGLFQTVGGFKLIECVVECPEPNSVAMVAAAALLARRRGTPVKKKISRYFIARKSVTFSTGFCTALGVCEQTVTSDGG
jgi:hypothetical protein